MQIVKEEEQLKLRKRNGTKYELPLKRLRTWDACVRGRLRKSEVEEREERARRWCHNYRFLMSLLLVSNNINHHGNFNGKSRVTRCQNNKSRIMRLTGSHHASGKTPLPRRTLRFEFIEANWTQRCRERSKLKAPVFDHLGNLYA